MATFSQCLRTLQERGFQNLLTDGDEADCSFTFEWAEAMGQAFGDEDMFAVRGDTIVNTQLDMVFLHGVNQVS